MKHVFELEFAEDDRLEPYRDLRWDRKPMHGVTHFIAEGRLCVQRLLESELQVNSVLVQRGKESEVQAWIRGETPVYSLPREQLKRLVGFDFHRGMMACGTRPDLSPLSELDLHHWNPSLSVAAIEVVERENLGGIMRSSTAFGIDTLIIGPGTADPFARKTIRVSMGTVFRLHLYRLDQPTNQLTKLRDSQVRTIATTLSKNAIELSRFSIGDQPCILLMGNEANGLSQEVIDSATDEVTIPMEMGTNSLNVSVATAIFLHDLVRQQNRG